MKKSLKTNQKIADYLISQDKKMEKVIAGIVDVKREIDTDYFSALVETIISQQISGKVAEVICGRLAKLCDNQVTPQALDKLGDEEIRSCGTSSAKVRYIRSLVSETENGTVVLNGIEKKSNEEIIEMLVKVKGIGTWSAEMFLIFSLGREDVFSYNDGALLRAIYHYYNKDQPMEKAAVIKLSKKWIPKRTYACLYLWDSIGRF